MNDNGGIKVSVGEVLDVFGGAVVLVPESTLDLLSRTAHEAFVQAAEEATGAVVFVVPGAAFTADVWAQVRCAAPWLRKRFDRQWRAMGPAPARLGPG